MGYFTNFKSIGKVSHGVKLWRRVVCKSLTPWDTLPISNPLVKYPSTGFWSSQVLLDPPQFFEFWGGGLDVLNFSCVLEVTTDLKPLADHHSNVNLFSILSRSVETAETKHRTGSAPIAIFVELSHINSYLMVTFPDSVLSFSQQLRLPNRCYFLGVHGDGAMVYVPAGTSPHFPEIWSWYYLRFNAGSVWEVPEIQELHLKCRYMLHTCFFTNTPAIVLL